MRNKLYPFCFDDWLENGLFPLCVNVKKGRKYMILSWKNIFPFQFRNERDTYKCDGDEYNHRKLKGNRNTYDVLLLTLVLILY